MSPSPIVRSVSPLLALALPSALAEEVDPRLTAPIIAVADDDEEEEEDPDEDDSSTRKKKKKASGGDEQARIREIVRGFYA